MAAMTMRAENRSPCTMVCELGMTKASSAFTRISFTSMFCTSVCSTSFSALRTSFCNFVSIVTAATAGIASNMYSCQFLPKIPLGTSVVRSLAMCWRFTVSVTIARMPSR